MASFQQVIIVGNLGRDPETRFTASGNAVTNFSIATSEQWTDKQSGEKQERTEWHNITFFGRAAEVAGEYLKKGSQCMVTGKLRTEKYTDKDGIERYSTKVYGDELKLLGSPAGGGGQGSGQRPQQGGGYGGQGQPGSRPRENQMPSPGSSSPPSQQGFDDDDIPF